jgi:hypothetical protein
MTQTVDALSGTNLLIEVSADNTTWTDISGASNSIEPGDQTRQTGVVFTFSGDTAIITSGKREPMDITVKAVYTETTGEAFEVVRAIHEGTGEIYIRWAPRGGTTGDAQYTSAKGVLSAFTYPGSAADDAKPIMAGFKVKVPKVTRALIA